MTNHPKEIQKHYYKKQWYKDIEFNIEPIEDVFDKVGEKLFHPHRLDFHQFILVTEGGGDHEVDFNHLKLKKNSIVPLIIGQIQSFKKQQNIKGYVIVFTSNFLVHEKVDQKYLYDFLTFNTLIQPFLLDSTPEINQLVEICYQTFQNKEVFEYEESLRALLKTIILKIEQEKRRFVKFQQSELVGLSMKFNKTLEEKISYKTKVSDVFRELTEDPKKISLAVKETTLKTPKQLLDERIVLELKRLLSYTDLSIKEIAFQLGFDETSNFTNYFKKHTDLTPTEFRNMMVKS
ncbi:helix-turn-helix domain-containing protein [Flammeovirga yaeyamensis]|uniref:Helix-turn-helix domain-containing protein n=1 Tax=Flammeovirga yaeyamensis TaxID=367791 RepID=A0AAX1N6C6_9BACT|nr:helix-turn-helix domain-containing protein [Flammeovirga yaeyamensis]MBB3698211.1 AraC-like DNA-binding protein [Flammeovirga yaeyamensis]NMF34434.1 AraC family transcriptional regulator [Flammeovirga yaeyamensis]QWG01413.1 helix-turn-helix domain-containing protein [Flammeovirga yaeyamensis]